MPADMLPAQEKTRTLPEHLSDPVTALRVLPDGPTYRLDDLRQYGEILTRICIGRSACCEIRLTDDTVSSMHCLLYRDQERVFVDACRNKNRIYINEAPLGHGMGELLSGFVLRLGLTRLLACGRAGDDERAFIVARGLDEFLHTAVNAMYGDQATASRVLGVATATMNRWYHEHRFERREQAPGSISSKAKPGKKG